MEMGELIPCIITMSIVVSVLIALPVAIMIGMYIAIKDIFRWWKDDKQ